MQIDHLSLSKFYEFYIQAIEKIKTDTKLNELEYLKTKLVISKSLENEITKKVSNLIQTNKSKLSNEVNREIRNINKMMVDDHNSEGQDD